MTVKTPTASGQSERLPHPRVRPMLSIEEAGEFLGMSRAAAYAAAKRGTLPTRQVSASRWRVATADLWSLLGLDPTQYEEDL